MTGSEALKTFLEAIPPIVAALVAAAPVVIPLAAQHMSTRRRDQILGVTKAAALIVSAANKKSPSPLGKNLESIVGIVESELGRTLSPAHIALVKNAALAMHADERKPVALGDVGAEELISAALTRQIPPAGETK